MATGHDTAGRPLHGLHVVSGPAKNQRACCAKTVLSAWAVLASVTGLLGRCTTYNLRGLGRASNHNTCTPILRRTAPPSTVAASTIDHWALCAAASLRLFHEGNCREAKGRRWRHKAEVGCRGGRPGDAMRPSSLLRTRTRTLSPGAGGAEPPIAAPERADARQARAA